MNWIAGWAMVIVMAGRVIADATVKFIDEAGGFIVDPPLDLPGGLRICLFK